jgi:hypothetical protein
MIAASSSSILQRLQTLKMPEKADETPVRDRKSCDFRRDFVKVTVGIVQVGPHFRR